MIQVNFFYVTANRHDSDRVELQLGFDGEVQSEKRYDFEVNIQFIFPKSLGLGMNFDKEGLKSQLQSHLRLHTHAGNPQNPTKLTRVRERLELMNAHLSEESLKFFALEIEAFLKLEIKTIKKSLRTQKDFSDKQMMEQLQETEALIFDYRKLLSQRHLMGKSAKDFSFDSFDHDLLLLDEYISHLYVVLLSHLKYYFESGHEKSELSDKIPILARKEAEHRKLLGYFLQDEKGKDTFEEEHYLLRASLLKKYFQKILFIRAEYSTRESRLLIPMYGFSAGIAAFFYMLIQMYQMQNQVQNIGLGIGTAVFLSVAICAYIIRDLIKDYTKKYFYRRSQKYFPDYVVKLSYIHQEHKKMLGNVEEFLRLSTMSELPSAVSELRFSRDGDLEPEVEEDVVEYKKLFHLNLKSLELREHYHWGIREVMRIRLDRFTTSMDDPTKMLHLLSPDGSIESHMGHRVYYLHMAVSIRPLNSFVSNDLGTLKLFRIKMDKTGVLSVDSVKKFAAEVIDLTGK